jgi:ABC-2 type transport system ATP-binding protein
MSGVLAERAATGVTVLFSSHQLDLVEDLCEAVAIIHHGRLVVSGPVADLERGERPRLAVRCGWPAMPTGHGPGRQVLISARSKPCDRTERH